MLERHLFIDTHKDEMYVYLDEAAVTFKAVWDNDTTFIELPPAQVADLVHLLQRWLKEHGT